MMKKNIVIVHYNTPYLTECLVRSINFFVKNAVIYIFDNSDKLPFTKKIDNVTIIDNTKGQIINFEEWLKNYPERIKTNAFKNNYGSAKHCYSIQKCIEIINENFILLDSDVLLKKDITPLFNDKMVFISDTEIWKAYNTKARPKIRAIPYICYINVELCKKHGIKYFNPDYIFGLTENGNSYDTGSYFYEQVKNKKLKWKKINLHNYIVHYKAASWIEGAIKNDGYKQISPEEWIEKNKNYCPNIKPKNKDKNNKVVYTCITGDYDSLITPKITSEGFDYICFTDNENLKSNLWKIKHLPIETESLNQIKKQRYVKTHPHILLKEYDISIWVDGNVEIVGNLNDFIKNNINEKSTVFVPEHPARKCIYEEEKAVIGMKKDVSANTSPQIERYIKEGYPKNNGLLQSNIILRKHNDEKCIKLRQ